MSWEWRTDRGGKKYRSFSYYDPTTKGRYRLPKKEVPDAILFDPSPEADKQADDFDRLRMAENEAAKLRIQKRLEWQNKFYDFDSLLKNVYLDAIKERVPNNWENNVYYVEQFVLPFFLTEKQSNNMNNWPLYFGEFRKWLAKLTVSKGGNRTYALATQNHVISALNAYMEIMYEKRLIAERADKCPKYAQEMLPVKGVEFVIEDQEQLDIEEAIRELNPVHADAYFVKRKTGMRLGELIGLSLADIHRGKPDHKIINDLLNAYGLKAYGYIYLLSQVADTTKYRGNNGELLRKPMKHRKTMSDKDARTIPLFEKATAEVIKARFDLAVQQYKKRVFGSELKNYQLFDGIEEQQFVRDLKKAYENVAQKKKKKYVYKSPHSCRHTFATWLAGNTLGTTGLCRLVLGHKNERVTEKYVHIFQSINRKAAQFDGSGLSFDITEDGD